MRLFLVLARPSKQESTRSLYKFASGRVVGEQELVHCHCLSFRLLLVSHSYINHHKHFIHYIAMVVQGEEYGWDTFPSSLFGRRVEWVEGDHTLSGTVYFSTSEGVMLVALFNGDSKEIQ